MAVTGHLIKRLRIEAGLTQKMLAKLVGVSQAHIAKIECGKVDPRLSTVNKILHVLTKEKPKKCKDLMTKGVLCAKPNDAIMKTSQIMVKNAISQMPVKEGKKIVGTITEEGIIRNLGAKITNAKVKDVMDPPLPMFPEEADINAVRPFLEKHQGVLITRGKEIVGIITRSDLLKTLS